MAGYTEVRVGQEVSFDSELLLIHARDTRDTGRPLAIMIHGLQGDGFNTWKSVLQSEWMLNASFDVGLVNYRSGLKRYRGLKQLSPKDIAADLAMEISQLSPKRIVLIGHSMGGLIAKETLQQLHRRFGITSPHTKSVVGIITLCSPATGSGWAKGLTFLPGPAWHDRRALGRHSEMQRDIEWFFSTWVDTDCMTPISNRHHVPTFSASAKRDLIVNQMGAELGVPVDQRGRLTGGHRSALHQVSTIHWLQNTVTRIFEHRPLTTLGLVQTIRAEFNGSAAFPSWESAYRRAIGQFEEEHGRGSLVDHLATEPTEIPDLIVRAYRAEGTQTGVPTEVHSDVTRQQQAGGRLALGISPIGSSATAALRELEMVVNAPRLRWFRAVEDNHAEIVAAFHEFFELTAGAAWGRPAGPMQSRPPSPLGGWDNAI